jgi:hypothetical protein
MMSKFIRILVIILLTTSTILFAQKSEEIARVRPLNSVYFNTLGDVSVFSINYERQFILSPMFILTSKLGLGYFREFFKFNRNPEKYLTIPHHITGNFGRESHFLEFGLGGTFISENATHPYLIYRIIGYRFMPFNSSKINFRVFVQTPFSDFKADDILFIPIGLSIGGVF